MFKWIIYFGVALGFISLQESELRRKAVIPGTFIGICSDNSGNVYSLRENELIKYDPDGKETRTYSAKVSGPISSVDVKGEHRILLFFQSSGQVIFLDNTLTPVGSAVSLVSLGFEDPRACCLSGNDGFWVYDAAKDAVFRLGWDGRKLNESPVLAEWRKESVPRDIMERENQLLLFFKEGDLLIMDQFGVPGKVILGKGRRATGLVGEILYFLNVGGDSLQWMNKSTLEEGVFILPADSCIDFKLGNQCLYLQEPTRISIYSRK